MQPTLPQTMLVNSFFLSVKHSVSQLRSSSLISYSLPIESNSIARKYLIASQLLAHRLIDFIHQTEK